MAKNRYEDYDDYEDEMEEDPSLARKIGSIFSRVLALLMIFIVVYFAANALYLYLRYEGIKDKVVYVHSTPPPVPSNLPPPNPSFSPTIDDGGDIDKSGKLEGMNIRQPIDKNVINILLLGDDSRSPKERARSDTMILFSFNRATGEVHLISFMRDILTINSKGKYQKLNVYYMAGGGSATVNIINDLFALDIQRYITVNFTILQDLVDAVGGVDVQLTPAEAHYITIGSQKRTKSGFVTLNGAQALSHARDRSVTVDGRFSDFGRVYRQRVIINAIYSKVKAKNTDPSALIDALFSKLRTNMDIGNALSVSRGVLGVSGLKITSDTIPQNKTWNSISAGGQSCLNIDYRKNADYIWNVIYHRNAP